MEKHAQYLAAASSLPPERNLMTDLFVSIVYLTGSSSLFTDVPLPVIPIEEDLWHIPVSDMPERAGNGYEFFARTGPWTKHFLKSLRNAVCL